MTRAEALALAAETVSKLAPPSLTNRGGLDGGAASLKERGDLVLRMATFLAAPEAANPNMPDPHTDA